MTQAYKDLDGANRDVESAAKNLEIVEAQNATTLQAARNAVEETTLAEDNLREQTKKAAQARADEALAAEQAREAEEALAEGKKQYAAQLQAELADVTAQAQQAIGKLDNQIAKHQQNIKDIEDAQQRTRTGMAADQQYHKGIGGEGYKYQLDERGLPASMTDWDRANRYAQRAERDAKKADRAASRNQKDYDKLRDKLENGERLTDEEMKKYDKLDRWNRERNGKQKEEAAIKKAEEERKNLEKKSAEAILDIQKKIAKLSYQ